MTKMIKNIPKKTTDDRGTVLFPEPGFSLLELTITIVILGFSSLILIPFFNSISHSPDPMLRQRAISLGQALMDEITAKKWDENTPSGGGPIDTVLESNGRGLAVAASAIGDDEGGVRAAYDDVDDYDTLSETDTFLDQNDVSFTLNGYSRTATVRYIASSSDPITATSPAGSILAADSTDSKRIVVTVTSPSQEQFSLVAVACNF